MSDTEVSLEANVGALVKFLDKFDYNDKNYGSRAERLAALQDIWCKTKPHFEQLIEDGKLPIDSKRIEKALRSGVLHVVCCWSRLPQQAMVDLCIYFVYAVLIDDSAGHGTSLTPGSEMNSFIPDLFAGNEQKHPFWRLMNEHLSSSLFRHYSPFCQLSIYRSTLDLYQGSWIESLNFLGHPGADYFPTTLRRMSSGGHTFAAAFFTNDICTEHEAIEEVATMMAQMDPYMAFPNDLISFFKETKNADDQVNLFRMYRRVHGMTSQQAFDRLTIDAIQSVEQMRTVFGRGRTPIIEARLNAFIQGYITWHFCDQDRYRLHEMYESIGDTADGTQFRKYYDEIRDVGWFDSSEWATPLTMNKDLCDRRK